MFFQNKWDDNSIKALTCTQESSYINYKGERVFVMSKPFEDPEPGHWKLYGDIADEIIDSSFKGSGYE